MIIKYISHSCFLITTSDGHRILIDPIGGRLSSGLFIGADFVPVSHNHEDHNNLQMVTGAPMVITGAGSHSFGSGKDKIEIEGFLGDHGTLENEWLGMVVLYRIKAGGLTLLHLSDLGEMPSDEEIKEFGKVDVLMVPTGGHYTIGPDAAWDITKKINPKIVIPMHYAQPGIDRGEFPILPLNSFTDDKEKVRYLRKTEFEAASGELPESTEIWVPNPSV